MQSRCEAEEEVLSTGQVGVFHGARAVHPHLRIPPHTCDKASKRQEHNHCGRIEREDEAQCDGLPCCKLGFLSKLRNPEQVAALTRRENSTACVSMRARSGAGTAAGGPSAITRRPLIQMLLSVPDSEITEPSMSATTCTNAPQLSRHLVAQQAGLETQPVAHLYRNITTCCHLLLNEHRGSRVMLGELHERKEKGDQRRSINTCLRGKPWALTFQKGAGKVTRLLEMLLQLGRSIYAPAVRTCNG